MLQQFIAASMFWYASGQGCTPTTCSFTPTLNGNPRVISPCHDHGLIPGSAGIATWNLNPPTICTNKYCGPNDGVYQQNFLPSNCSAGWYGQLVSGNCRFLMNCWYQGAFGSLRGTLLHNFGPTSSANSGGDRGRGYKGFCTDAASPFKAVIYPLDFYVGFGTTNGNRANPVIAERVGGCTPCPAGLICGSNTVLVTAATRCPAGYFCADGTTPIGGAKPPVICPAGSSCPSGSGAPVPCPPGFFSTSTGQATCAQCPAGYATLTAGQTSCATVCPAGSYCPGGAAIGCPAGMESAAVGATSFAMCTSCVAPYYSDVAGMAECRICPSGFYGATSGLNTSACSGQCAVGYLCPAGSTSPAALSCTNNNPAFFCPAGTAGPQPCSGNGQMTGPPSAPASNRYQCIGCGINRACSLGGMLDPVNFGSSCPGGFSNAAVVSGTVNEDVGLPFVLASPGWAAAAYNVSLIVTSPDPTCTIPVLTFNSATGTITLRSTGTPMPYCYGGYLVTLSAARLGDPAASYGWDKSAICKVTLITTQLPMPPDVTCSPLVVPEFTGAGVRLPVTLTSVNRNFGSFLFHRLNEVVPFPNAAGANPFIVDGCTGQLSTVMRLLHATARSYLVSISVDNMGLTPLKTATCNFTVSITKVNLAPQLAETAFVVIDNAGAGSAVGNVLAFDPNNDPVSNVRFVGTSYPFSIDTQGNITVVATGVLDALVVSKYILSVNATDGVAWTVTSITISMLSAPRPPSCLSQAMIIADSMTPGMTLASQLAGSHALRLVLTYSLAGSAAPNLIVNASTGILTLNTTLDYNVKKSYTTSYTVTDSNGMAASCPLTVNVVETNKAPNVGSGPGVMGMQNVTVAEGSLSGEIIGYVTASDANIFQVLRYTAVACAPLLAGACPLQLDSATGRLIVGSANGASGLMFNETLNYASLHTITLMVNVTDNGSPAITTQVGVYVLITAIAPRVSLGTFNLPASATAGLLIANVGLPTVTYLPSTYNRTGLMFAWDRYAVYKTAEGQTAFTITPAGVINVASPLPTWDYTTRPSYSLSVLVSDLYTLREGTGTLTVNLPHVNRAPRWTSFPRLLVGARFNGNIGPLLSTFVVDLDVGATGVAEVLTFSISGGSNGNTDNTFQVSAGGQISTANPNSASFVYSPLPVNIYNISMKVCDAGIDAPGSVPACAVGFVALEVTQGNNPPTFSANVYAVTVSETALAGDAPTGPTLPAAFDPNAGQTLTYSILGSAGPFQVNPTTGALTVRAAGLLDYETVNSWNVTLVATDSFVPPMATSSIVTIAVIDENEPAVFVRLEDAAGRPVTSLAISENVTLGSVIGRFVALDVDASGAGAMLFVLVNDPESVPFEISETTGVITLNGDIDWEDKALWRPTVRIQDGTVNPAVFSRVITIDIRDSPDVVISALALAAGQVSAGNGVDGAEAEYGAAFAGMSSLFATRGGAQVVLTGTGFGYTQRRLTAEALPSTPLTALTVRFGTGGPSDYTATCTITTPYTQLTCTVPPGFGSKHVWKVLIVYSSVGSVVNSGMSVLMTGYVPPAITTVSLASAASDTDVATNAMPTGAGGVQIKVIGTNFGPTGTPISLIYGTAASPGTYTVACTNTGASAHTTLLCTPAPGVGAAFVFQVSVGSGVTGVSLVHTSSVVRYAAPEITVLRPSASILSTVGGESIQIGGLNFGPLGTDSIVVTYVSGSGPVYAATACRVSTAHVQISCLTAPGAGVGHKWSVSVAGQSSIASVDTTAYLPPRLLSLSGQGSAKAATEGGQPVILVGKNFGPATPLTVSGTPTGDALVPIARYGRATASTPFLSLAIPAANCLVTVADVQMVCDTTEGSGKDLVWAVSVAGQTSTLQLNVTSSYAPPVIASYSGPGSARGDTAGGQFVYITGRNFGSLSASITSVTYGVNGTDLKFTASGCLHTPATPHTEIRCTTEVGAGAGLGWQLVIDGLSSTAPTTDYAPPEILTATIVGGSLGGEAHTDGGDVLLITGKYFSTTAFLTSVRYGFGGSGFAAENCTVTIAHSQITCKTAPGSGRKLTFSVTVGEQTGPVSTAFIHYAAPTIASIAPSRGSTAGGVTILVTGTNLGLALASSKLEIRMDAERPSSVQRPTTAAISAHLADLYDGGSLGDASVAAWLNAMTRLVPIFPSFVRRTSAAVSFVLPEGYGAARDVLLFVNGVPSNLVTFNYDTAQLLNLAPDRFNVSSNTMLRLFVEGTSFCSGRGGCGKLIVGGVPVVTMSFTHDRIMAEVTDPAQSGAGSSTVQVEVDGVLSNMLSFSTPVPAFDAITGQGNWGGASSIVVESASLSFSLSIEGPLTTSTLLQPTVAGPLRSALAKSIGVPTATVDLTSLTDRATGVMTTVRATDAANTVPAARLLQQTGLNISISVDVKDAIVSQGGRLSVTAVSAFVAGVTQVLTSLSSNTSAAVLQAVATAAGIPLSSLSVEMDLSSIVSASTTKTVASGGTMSTRGGELFFISGVNAIHTVPESDIKILLGGVPCAGLTKTFEADTHALYGIPDNSPLAAQYISYKLSCRTPPGVGSSLPIQVQTPTGTSKSDPNFLFSYSPPTVDAVVDELSPSVSYTARDASGALVAGIPTLGKLVRIVGSNFGNTSLVSPTLKLSVLVTNKLSGKTAEATVVSHDHEVITAQFPVGQGKDIVLSIFVAGQSDTDPLSGSSTRASTLVRYRAPVIILVTNPSSGLQGDPNRGGTLLSIIGSNFGTASASDSLENGRPIVTIGGVPGMLLSTFVPTSDHTKIDLRLPLFWGGNLPVVVTVSGQSSTSIVTYSYAVPTITDTYPLTAPTSGRRADGSQINITIMGDNLGQVGTVELRPASPSDDFPIITVPSAAMLSHNLTHIIFPVPEGAGSLMFIAAIIGGQTGVASSLFSYDKPSIESIVSADRPVASCTPSIVRIKAGSSYVNKTVYPSYPGCFPTMADPPFTLRINGESFGAPFIPVKVTVGGKTCDVISHTHNTAVCTAPSGMGDANNVVLTVAGRASVITSRSIFAYDPPVITAIMPNTPDAAEGQIVDIKGHNFGPVSSAVTVTFGSKTCEGAAWLNDGLLRCTAAGDTVGRKNVTILAGNRTEPFYWSELDGFVEFRCKYGFYGLQDETCVKCGPEAGEERGALCKGGELMEDTVVSLPGWWRFNVKEPAMCHPLRVNRALSASSPGCPVFTACEPLESCLGANKCAPQYTGDRCATCFKGFYRVNGECVKCPDSPWAVVIVFIFAAMAALGIAYTLNAKSVNLALISIGMDWAQVVAMFARTRIRWPALVKQLFLFLSAFNLNLELIAPECAIPDVTYSSKWLFIEGMPLFAWLLLALVFCCKLCFKSVIKSQTRSRLYTHLPVLVATGVVVQRVLYLYETRSTLDIFNCSPTDPPEFDKNGKEILYMAWNLEIKCNEPGGSHLWLLPFAVAALVIYVVGFPVASLMWLWKNKETVMYDQILRARLTGDDRITNPFYSFRKTWKALYMNYRPDCWYWEIVVVMRKFLIAFCSLMFRRTPSYQLAMALLVLFVSFVLQVRENPYLSHAVSESTSIEHARKVIEGDALHVRIEETMRALAAYNSRAGSGARGTSMQAKGKKGELPHEDRAPVSFVGVEGFIAKQRTAFQRALLNGRAIILRNNVANTIFDYNTAESLLLSSAILVSLAGICFDSSRFQGDTGKRADVQSEYEALAVAVLLVLFISIIYWFVSMALDIALVVSPACVSKLLHSMATVGKSALSHVKQHTHSAKIARKQASLNKDNMDGGSDVMVMTANVAMASAGPDSSAFDAQSIQDMQAVPDEAAWRAIKASYGALSQRARLVAEENARLRSDMAMVSEQDPESPLSPRSKRTFTPQQLEGGMTANPMGPSKNMSLKRLSSMRKPSASALNANA